MAIVKKNQVAEIKPNIARNDTASYIFFRVENAPRYFNSYDEAETWVKEKGDYQKTYSM